MWVVCFVEGERELWVVHESSFGVVINLAVTVCVVVSALEVLGDLYLFGVGDVEPPSCVSVGFVME